ncbi:hypothetical protein GPN2_22756 [Streptomyces murinus]
MNPGSPMVGDPGFLQPVFQWGMSDMRRSLPDTHVTSPFRAFFGQTLCPDFERSGRQL